MLGCVLWLATVMHLGYAGSCCETGMTEVLACGWPRIPQPWQLFCWHLKQQPVQHNMLGVCTLTYKCAAEIQVQVQCAVSSSIHSRVQLPHNVHQCNTSVNLEFGDVYDSSSSNKHGSLTRQALLASAGNHSIANHSCSSAPVHCLVSQPDAVDTMCVCCKLKIDT